jgi:uncharacterized membrane protein
MRPFFHSLCLLLIALWWMLFFLWRPSTISFLQDLTFRFEPPTQPIETIHGATQRAIEYSTRGTSLRTDIYFSPDEISHLLDVALLYQKVRLIFGGAAIFCLSVLIIERARKHIDRRAFLYAARGLASVGIFVSLAVIFFTTFFLRFHELFFPQGNWAFPEQSLLIASFPELFWRICVAGVLVMLVTLSIVYWAIYNYVFE